MTARKGLHFGASVIAFGLAASSAVAAAFAAGGCFVGIDEGLLDASGSKDAGADAVHDLGIPCGDASCAPPVSVCCSSSFGDTDYRRGACSTRNGCTTGDYLACTSAADCRYQGAAGPYCCVVRLPGGAFTQTACQATCDGGDALCTQGDDTTCPSPPAGSVCRASLEFPVLFSCLPP